MNGLAGVNLSQLRVNPTEPENVYGLAVDGVARSEDKGRTWQFTPAPSNPTDWPSAPARPAFPGDIPGRAALGR